MSTRCTWCGACDVALDAVADVCAEASQCDQRKRAGESITTLAGLTAEIERLKLRLAALEPCPAKPWRDPHLWIPSRSFGAGDARCSSCGLVRARV